MPTAPLGHAGLTATDLQFGGIGGGPGGDSQPLQAMDDDFIADHCALAVDKYGIGAIVRCDYTYQQNAWKTGMTPASSIGSTNQAQIDRVCYWAAKVKANVMINFHTKANASGAGQHREPAGLRPGIAIPHIFNSGKMDGLNLQASRVSQRYCGLNATLRAQSPVKLQNGSTVLMPDDWQGVLFLEPWNEPNSIGDCGGLINDGGGALSNWDTLVWRIHRDTLDAWAEDKQSRQLSHFIGAMCIGSIDFPYMNAFTSHQTADNQLVADADYASVHVYEKGNPRTNNGSTAAADSRHINTIQSSYRPWLDGQGGAACKVVISECITGGSNQWNRFQKYNDGNGLTAGVGKAEPSELPGYADNGTIYWEADYAYPGYTPPANQDPADLSQQFIYLNFFQQADVLNAMNPPAGIMAIIQHIGLQKVAITRPDATSGDGWNAYHRSRASARAIGHRYVRAAWTGTPKKWRSSDWKPECETTSDWWYAAKNKLHPGDTVTPPPGPPVVISSPADTIADVSATLRGTVNPVGQDTTYFFEYGLTTAYGSTTTTKSAGNGTSAKSVAFGLTGLTPSTTYHWRLTATNADGTSHSVDRHFATEASAPPPPPTIDVNLFTDDNTLRIEPA